MSVLSAGGSIPQQLLGNGVLAWALAACGLAQLAKVLVELVLYQRWRPAVLLETGGMPSSHSALVTGAAAGTGWQLGFDDPLFALACAVAFVVMYDATGVRYAAGLQAKRINSLPAALWQEASVNQPTDLPADQPADLSDKLPVTAAATALLKETLGHTRLEVLVGSLIGPAIALCGLALAGSPLQIARGWGWLPIG
ncbi:divergent PAP2 family protein [Synechococcus sp. CS-602]|uniref:divergent PAP2 family protein n=1 Tax=Synechococcaceae TaxID=1890426 RepID=UPI0008FF10E2|nr:MULTISPECIES: divergent PAP2 family protein [Synechococcaceae]MCT4365660.1 divergent PAP2 family protein [Candidatus Regnicoccus frigidus MAG-AL1]APD47358.1 phosphatidic acid phosphatase [Synechococcus sp. SynAce01]MCT0202728.1 divergent PAP2 family protein [Synechococcus sp. CS-603]MCT0203644.1 divergent PAP2 family protein [Synechococcus sp. CS-602]MCT0246084.1 divergent PAP2 family protein [Synechococcus sp. CS-601]